MRFDAKAFLTGLSACEPLPAGVPTKAELIGPDDLDADWRVAFEERAAIMEYDGGLLREHAEAEAMRCILEEMRRNELDPKANMR